MNEFDKLRSLAKQLKEEYPPGTRVELISMNDPSAVPPNTRGTVKCVDDMGQIHVKWDNGRTLALNYDEDSFRKLSEQEILQENPKVVDFGDEAKIILPKEPVNCCALGFFDGLEEDCWKLVEQYCAALGVQIVSNQDGEFPISYDIAKSVQDTILGKLEEVGLEICVEENNHTMDM